ncbi:hypothetical protein GCK32_011684 [Trichostrongylus colubriformis]|uniref:Uncharacterized protein n=1 Tax=Trichostrongylus colubriformis TaxID=6319 RepID=A0AAN8FL69_TRICO
MRLILAIALVTIASAQLQNGRFTQANERLPCGFSCSRRTSVLTMLDGVLSRAECSDRTGNVMARCSSCCAMKALSEGLTTVQSSGFLSVDGADCICCFNNNRC